jgi:hypothetical protein
VKSKLLQEGAISFQESDTDENALLLKKKYVVRCFYYNRVGHKQYDCPSNKTKERREDKEKGDKKKELKKKEDKSYSFKRSKGFSHITALSASSNSDAWYIDSGATVHMKTEKTGHITIMIVVAKK